jgi:hypothetical protein
MIKIKATIQNGKVKKEFVKFYPIPFADLNNYYQNLSLFKFLNNNKRIGLKQQLNKNGCSPHQSFKRCKEVFNNNDN